MESNNATIETLNDLVQINNDRIEGYEKAVKEVGEEDADLKQFFLARIDESRSFKMELGTEIEVLGKDIENHTTGSGGIHRAWIALKETFTGHSTKSILEECEFGEDAIKKAYESALEEEHLPAYIKDILDEQLDVILTAHNEVKSLRDSA